MSRTDDLTAIEAADVALVQVAGLQIVADAQDDEDAKKLVSACVLVLDGLLENRLHLPQQRSESEASCTASPSARPARSRS